MREFPETYLGDFKWYLCLALRPTRSDAWLLVHFWKKRQRQPCPQANSRYPSERRRRGTQRDSEKWHKSTSSARKSPGQCSTKTCFWLQGSENVSDVLVTYIPNEHLRIIVDGIETKCGCHFVGWSLTLGLAPPVWICRLLSGVLDEFSQQALRVTSRQPWRLGWGCDEGALSLLSEIQRKSECFVLVVSAK